MRMTWLCGILLSALNLIPISALADGLPTWPKGAEFERIEGDTLHFKAPEGTSAPSPLKTGLFDLKHLGKLNAPTSYAPFFLVAAKPCKDCQQDEAIFVVRHGLGKPYQFVYPGKILHPKTHELMYQSRGFFGHCLTGSEFTDKDVYVVFQKEKVDRRKGLQSSVFVAVATNDSLDEKLFERKLPVLDRTLKLVKKKTCIEVDGRNRTMAPKPPDIRIPKEKENIDLDKEEDDPPPTPEKTPSQND